MTKQLLQQIGLENTKLYVTENEEEIFNLVDELGIDDLDLLSDIRCIYNYKDEELIY